MELGQRFAKLLGEDKTKDIVDVLRDETPHLQQITDAFANILRGRFKTEQNIEVASFNEELRTSALSEASTLYLFLSHTTPGRKGAQHQHVTDLGNLDRHQRLGHSRWVRSSSYPSIPRHMAQFDTKSEPGYMRIKAVLQRWVDALQKTRKAVPASVSFPPP